MKKLAEDAPLIQEPTDNRLKLLETVVRQRDQLLKQVRTQAITLADTHPNVFLVKVMKNRFLSELTATTQLEVLFDGRKVDCLLSLTMIHRHDGEKTEEVILTQIGQDRTDGGLSYRLQTTYGPRATAEHQYFVEAVEQYQDFGLAAVLLAQADAGFEDNGNWGKAVLSDTYAETTMSTQVALDLLEQAQNIRPPQGEHFQGRMTLEDFRTQMRDRTPENASPPLFLGQ